MMVLHDHRECQKFLTLLGHQIPVEVFLFFLWNRLRIQLRMIRILLGLGSLHVDMDPHDKMMDHRFHQENQNQDLEHIRMLIGAEVIHT